MFGIIILYINIYEKELGTELHMIAKQQTGYLGIESAREELGITVSYWQDLESIRSWKQQSDHLMAQQLGRANWYKEYKVRVSKVERDYSL